MLTGCHFYVRVPVGDQFRYDRVNVSGPQGDSTLHTEYPPLVGDLIHLYDKQGHQGQFRVIERAWMHSSWGSFNWPYGEPRSKVGPTLDLIVEPADGLFVNEAPTPDEED